MNNPEYYMRIALNEAKKAAKLDEVPVGCVIVHNDKVIAKTHNLREHKNSALGHAEIIAIQKANKRLKAWRLEECDIYITLEPCLMCGGAIIQSRLRNVYFGAYDLKGGSFGSSINLLDAKDINHHPNIHPEVLKEECSNILSEYFKRKRTNK